MTPTPSEPSLASWMREAGERLDAATPGPWRVEEERKVVHGKMFSSTECGYPIGDVETFYDSSWVEFEPKDADFIAHAPEDLRRALDALERVELLCQEKSFVLLGSVPLLQVEQVRAALSGRPAQ